MLTYFRWSGDPNRRFFFGFDQAEKDQGSVPLVLWGHGGGMILGSCKDSWSASFMLAVQAG